MPRIDLIQIRRGTAAAWSAANPVLADGELGMESGTRLFKVGPGAWNGLPYLGADFHVSSSVADGVTDATAAINAARDAAVAAGGGTVVLPSGTLLISGRTVFPNGVQLRGPGAGACFVVCTTAGAGFSFGDLVSSTSYGSHGGFHMSGNGIADNPIYIGVGTTQHFHDIRVLGGKTNILIEGLQNSLFENVDANNPGTGYSDYGIVVDKGALNLTFLSSSLTLANVANLLVRQSTVTPAVVGAGVKQPGKLLFLGCIVENAGAAGNNISITAGADITFERCSSSAVGANAPVKLRHQASPTNAAVALRTGAVTFRDCNLNFGDYSIDARDTLGSGVFGGGSIEVNLVGATALNPYNLATSTAGVAGILADDSALVKIDAIAQLTALAPTKLMVMAAGSVYRAADLLLPSTGTRQIIKATDEARASTTAHADDADLKLFIPSRGRFHFRFHLLVRGATTGDIKYKVIGTDSTNTVTNKAKAGNTATLTLNSFALVQPGDQITVAISDPAFDGTVTVTAVAPVTGTAQSTVSYVLAGADVASQAASGTITGQLFTASYLLAAPGLATVSGADTYDSYTPIGANASTGAGTTSAAFTAAHILEGDAYAPAGGYFKLQWAQNAASATATTMMAGSALTVQRIDDPGLGLRL